MSDGDKVLSWIRDWLADGGAILMIADYDGTLSPLVHEPSQAWLEAGVRDHLRSLATCPRVRLTIISGRDLVDLRARVGVPDAIYAGCHGLEVDGPDMSFSHPEAEAQQDSLRMIGLALNQRMPSVEGMRVEAKRLGLAIHYRDVPAERMREVEDELARAIQKSGHRLKIFHGSKVIEILPQVGWNKGRCALWIREAVQRLSARRGVTTEAGRSADCSLSKFDSLIAETAGLWRTAWRSKTFFAISFRHALDDRFMTIRGEVLLHKLQLI